MALLYGYLFPLIYLVAFWVLYRHEKIPLLRHMGELLTVAVLGGACFGLPTTMVGERERGVWRRYRLTPVPTWAIVTSTVAARFIIVLTAGLVQFAAALAIGMSMPAHPLDLFVAFTFVSFAFIGLGLVIAMLADNVAAVQALGQCIFLPMLIIGGVAVQLASLPPWAQHVSAFFPGRYAVEAMQSCVTGAGFVSTRFSLLALAVIGAAGCLAGAGLFRWDAQQRFSTRAGKAWLVPVFAAWLAVGLLAESRGRISPTVESDKAPLVAAPTLPNLRILPRPAPTPTPPPQPPWTKITDQDVAALDYGVPPDGGVVAPFAPADEDMGDELRTVIDDVARKLRIWPPGQDENEVQRVRYFMCVAAVPDAVQMPLERYLPPVVLKHLESVYPKEKLVKILAWIVLHPEEGDVIDSLSDLGVNNLAPDQGLVRERITFYATKFIMRLTGRKSE